MAVGKGSRGLVLRPPTANLGVRQRDHVVQQPAVDLHLPDRRGGDGAVDRRRARSCSTCASTGSIGVPGWASIMVSIWFLGGLIIFCIGVIGIYLAKVFTEVKQRPVHDRPRAHTASIGTVQPP